MTFGVFIGLSVLGLLFASFCGALAGCLVGFYMRPIIFATGPMKLPAEEPQATPLIVQPIRKVR